MKLVYETSGDPVKVGDRIEKDGYVWVVDSIQEPHHAGSTGRVYVSLPDWQHPNEPRSVGTRGYFPGVIGAVWIEREDRGWKVMLGTHHG